jgi:2,5-dihydroxypyridine 5,6-dioxygenase
MLTDRMEGKWVADFVEVLGLCKVEKGEVVAILSETQSRRINVELAEMALTLMGARCFHVVMPTPRQTAPVPVRSTGSSHALQGIEPVLMALRGADMVVDVTVEGILHAPETPSILKAGTRVFMISNEHPEILERLKPDPALRPKVERGIEMLAQADEMRVTSAAGTDLTARVAGAPARGAAGLADTPGKFGYWPAGLCLCFPLPGTVNGRLVLAPGDVNLTFKTYIADPVTLTVEDNYVTAIEGDGPDAAQMRSYFAAWDERAAYGVSHIGWGMNPAARWDAMVMYDKADHNGTELRAFAGNFLFSTGANENANIFTQCHFDLPMRNCTVALDGREVVTEGRLCPDLT